MSAFISQNNYDNELCIFVACHQKNKNFSGELQVQGGSKTAHQNREWYALFIIYIDCLIPDRLSMVFIIDTPYEAIFRKVRRTYQQRLKARYS